MNNTMRFPQNYCSHCKLITPTLDGYYYKKCSKCYNPVKKDNFFNKIILITVFLFVIQLLLFGALVSASPVDINPFSSNPSNGSTVNTRYVNLGWNITSVNPLDTILFNYNNTNYSLYDNSLVLYYNFDNRSSLGENDTLVMDISKYGNNATISGGNNITINSSGYYNSAITLNGQVSRINTTSTISKMNKENGTFSLWVNVFGNSSNQGIGGIARIDAHTRVFLYADFNQANQPTIFGIQCGNPLVAKGSSIINRNQWYHVALTYEQINSTTINCTMYMNGVYQTSLLANNVSTSPTYINLGQGINDRWFNGSLDDIKIFNRALTSNEVNKVYNSHITKFNNTNLDIIVNTSILASNFNFISINMNDSSNNNNFSFLSLRAVFNLIFRNSLNLNINNYFYGSNIHSSKYLVNATDGSWLQNEWLNSKMKFARVDASYGSFYTNQTARTNGVNRSSNLELLQNQTSMIKWNQANGIKTLVIADYMPTWLADNSSGMCLDLNFCPATNYTIFGNIVLDHYYALGCTPSTCEIEIWNEPYLDTFFMGKLGFDNITKATNYTKMYSETRAIIMANNPNIRVGGPAGYRVAPNLMTTFLTNVSIGNRSFISTHPYDIASSNNQLQYLDTKALFGNCTALGVNCGSDIYLTEWNVGTSAIQNLTDGFNKYRSFISQSYQSMLNNYPANISSFLYQWTELSKYNSSYTEYPYKWAMLSGPTFDNSYAPSYNVTYGFTRYAPAQGTIYNSTLDNSEVQSVASKYSNACNIILTNTINDYQNVSVSFDNSLCGSTLIDTSNGNLIQNGSTVVLSEYDVRYLTKPVYSVNPDGTTDINNYLGEFITLISTPSSLQGTGACVSIIYQLQQYPVLIGLIGAVFLIGLTITIVFGWSMLKPGVDVSKENVIAFFIMLLGIGVLVIIGIVILDSLCSAGIY